MILSRRCAPPHSILFSKTLFMIVALLLLLWFLVSLRKMRVLFTTYILIRWKQPLPGFKTRIKEWCQPWLDKIEKTNIKTDKQIYNNDIPKLINNHFSKKSIKIFRIIEIWLKKDILGRIIDILKVLSRWDKIMRRTWRKHSVSYRK